MLLTYFNHKPFKFKITILKKEVKRILTQNTTSVIHNRFCLNVHKRSSFINFITSDD